MNLMFSYPIKRQKILASQMLAVWSFNFVALILTKLAIYMCVLSELNSCNRLLPLILILAVYHSIFN